MDETGDLACSDSPGATALISFAGWPWGRGGERATPKEGLLVLKISRRPWRRPWSGGDVGDAALADGESVRKRASICDGAGGVARAGCCRFWGEAPCNWERSEERWSLVPGGRSDDMIVVVEREGRTNISVGLATS